VYGPAEWVVSEGFGGGRKAVEVCQRKSAGRALARFAMRKKLAAERAGKKRHAVMLTGEAGDSKPTEMFRRTKREAFDDVSGLVGLRVSGSVTIDDSSDATRTKRR